MYTQISDIIGFFGNLIYGRTVEGELATRNPAGHSMLADVEVDEAAGHAAWVHRRSKEFVGLLYVGSPEPGA